MSATWAVALRCLLQTGPCLVVTIAGVRGSAPRAAGTRMILTRSDQWGSIGGGNLEYQATAKARELLEGDTDQVQQLCNYGLGPALNQCCGGAVEILYERFSSPPEWLETLTAEASTHAPSLLVSELQGSLSRKRVIQDDAASDPDIPQEIISEVRQTRSPALHRHGEALYMVESMETAPDKVLLFGAGHVGQALAPVLAGLSIDLRWLDSRVEMIPGEATDPAGPIFSDDPAAEVAAQQAGCIYLVMTHSHELDEEICDAVLRRGDARWLGLIGSHSKRQRFVHRLSMRGHAKEALDRLICPIGLSGIKGKRPATIAVSVAAQLLRDCIPPHHR